MTQQLRTLGLITLAVATACTPGTDGRPRPTEPDCIPFTLDSGDRICLPSRPLDRGTPGDRSEGARIESLTDPMFVGPLEGRVDLRDGAIGGCLQVRNQGECGWCVTMAVGAALDALFCAEGCPPPRVSMPHLRQSHEGGTLRDCSGAYVEDAMRAGATTPVVGEDVWPYGGTPRVMDATNPGMAALMRDPRYSATGHGSIMMSRDGTQLDAMKRAIASGRVLAVSSGVCFSQGWQNGNSTIAAPTGPCHPATATDPERQYDGYHAYTIVGYDDTTMEFIALNSWGERWGDGGYFRISYAFAQQELREARYFEQIDRSNGGCEMDEMTPREPVDRCAAITDCAACTASTGCHFCDGTCMHDTVTTVCRESLTNPNECPVPTGACSANTDCSSCAAAPGCAWCQGRNACVSWPSESGYCDGFGTRVAYLPSQCNDATGACETATTCDACVAQSGCGWCPTAAGTLHAGATSHCFGGTTAPDRVTCATADWTPPGGMCPMPDAGMAADAGPADDSPTTPPSCDSLACGDCVTTPGCSYCPSSGECLAEMDASSCSDASTDPAVCAECNDIRGTCVADANCCGSEMNSNIQCVETYCEDISMCGENGSACDASDTSQHCCGAQICGLDTGSRPECCAIPGQPCMRSGDCCGFEQCVGGMCQPQPTGGRCMNTEECTGADYCNGEGVCGTSG